LSPVSAHLEITYLARALSHTLHTFEQLSPCILLGLGITWAFSHPQLFVSRSGVLSVFQAAAHTVYACALPAATFDPVNEVLTHPSCLKYFRLDVYYHATSNTHGTQIDRSCDFQGPPATAGVSRALILPPFPQLKEAAELQPIHHHVRE
jgi:hypothetical protein